jgi:hypothetical protein
MLAAPIRNETVAALRQEILGWESATRGTLSFSSGCAALDCSLPGRGLPRGALVEFLADRGSGAVALALIAAREACRENGALVIVDRERRFYPPAAAALGIDLASTIFVRPRTRKEQLWALNQAINSAGVGAVLAWPEKLDDRVFRALQLAAEQGGAAGLFIRPTGVRGHPTWSAVQLLVETHPAQSTMPTGKPVRRLRIEVLRCRQGQAGGSVEVELNDETGTLEESCAVRVDSRLARAASAACAPGA